MQLALTDTLTDDLDALCYKCLWCHKHFSKREMSSMSFKCFDKTDYCDDCLDYIYDVYKDLLEFKDSCNGIT